MAGKQGFLKIDGVEGNSKNPQFQGWIEFQGDFSITTGADGVHELSFVTSAGQSSTQLKFAKTRKRIFTNGMLDLTDEGRILSQTVLENITVTELFEEYQRQTDPNAPPKLIARVTLKYKA